MSDITPGSDYWAVKPVEELVQDLHARIQTYESSSKILRAINARHARSYAYYYSMESGGLHAGSQVLRAGEQGELAAVRVNHSRALVNTLLNLITASKIVWSPKAVNVDYDSLRECELAAALLEYYWAEQKYSQFAVRALEEALVFGDGFVMLDWDKAAGDDSMPTPDMQGMIKSGDVRVRNVSTWDVIRDTNAQSWDDLTWCMVRVWENRYDLAAQYPQQAELIKATSDDKSVNFRHVLDNELHQDLVPVYYFFHKRTAAMPTGRHTRFVSAQCPLEDGPLDAFGYGTVPLHRVSAGEMFTTPFGYTPYQEILGIQELMDSLHTSIASNQSTFATQCIVTQQGSEFSPDEIAGGMKVLYVPPGAEPPKALQLTASPPEVFKHLDGLKQDQELLFGLNSVVRGTPQSGEQSGSALALLSSQALQQANVISSNYIRFVEFLGAGVLELIQNNLAVERQVDVAGKGNSFLIAPTQYSGAKLRRVKRVQVEVGNPLSQNASGRLTIAKDLLQGGLVKTPEQYLQVLTSGKLEPLTRGVSDELLLIRGENEALANGENPPVLYVDDHMLHVREHRGILCNMEARKNPAIIQAVMQHVKEHEQVYYTTEPALLMLFGQKPPMAPPPPELLGGQPGGVPGGGGGGPPQGPQGKAPPEGAAEEIKTMPGNPAVGKLPPAAKQPINPATNERYNPTDGGGAVPPPQS